MMILLFIILMLTIFGKLIFVAFKAAWGISKVILTLVLLPVILVIMAVGGLFAVAIPALIVIGVITLLCGVFAK